MKNETDTLIVGATYFGIGYASAHPKECTVIESSQVLGGDFHQNLRPADVQEAGEREASTELGKLMRRLHIWEEDRFDVLKSAPAIHKYAAEKENDIHILLDARIISISGKTNGYEVKYMDNEGIHLLHCNKILDTTMCRDTYPAGARCSAKTLNLFTAAVTEDFEGKLKNVCPECRVFEGPYAGEKVVKFPFGPTTGRLAACAELTNLWKKAFPEGEEKILFVAEEFEYVCEETEDGEAPCPWYGESFANPLSAFTAGMDYRFS